MSPSMNWTGKRSAQGGLRLVAVCVALVAGGVGSSRADELVTMTGERLEKIKITGYAEGTISFRQPAGEFAELSILDLRTVLVNSLDVKDINEAELYMVQGEPTQAVLRYERALRATDGFWKELVHVRLLRAYDQAVYPDKAVIQWLRVMQHDARVAAQLIPQSIPRTRTPAVGKALSALERCLGKESAEPRRQLTKLLRFAIYSRIGADFADEVVREVAVPPLVGAIATESAYAIKLAGLRRLLEMGEVDAVLTAADAAIQACPQASLPGLLLLKGEAQYATAVEEADYVRAGWSFMRVPIHFPDDGSAGRCLWWAARVHERIGRTAKAADLLGECLAVKTLDAETRAEATAALRRLTESGGS
ncbi:MAG: hypothetical protein GY842_06995 [bacterium]|nr:hypothetical protein [bacterium]